jgi:hypothetical protein
MNLLNRYLQAVSKSLPAATRNDIVAELRANILAQMEDREQELGHPLTDDQQAEILRRFGNPAIVAGRYSEHNFGLAFGKQLIGPELFPFYRTVLIVNALITLFVFAGEIPIVLATGGGFHLTPILLPLAIQFSIVTFIFVMVERHKTVVLGKWDPRKLPQVKADPDDGIRAGSIIHFLADAIGTFWLALTPQWPFLMLGPGALALKNIPIQLMPQWTAFYWAIVALLCAQLVLQFFTLFLHLPRRAARIANLALKSVGLCIEFLLIAKAPDYVSSPLPQVANWVNQTFLLCLIAALVIHLWGAGKLLLSLLHDRPGRSAPAGHHV